MDKKTFLDNFGLIADAPNGIKQLRELILDLATSGQLVPISKWSSGCLDDLVSEKVTDGDWVESKDQDPNGDVRLIQLADIGIGEFKNKSNRYMSEEAAQRLRCTDLQEGDILIARLPDPIGRACIFPKLEQRCVTVVDVAIVRPKIELMIPEYLVLVLNAPTMRKRVLEVSAGTTRRRVATGKLRVMDLQYPAILDEQRRIVAKVDELMALCDQLEAEKTKQETLRTVARASAIDAISTATTPEELSTAWSRISNNWEIVANDNQGIGALRDLIRKLALEGWLSSSVQSDESVTSLISRIADKREDLSLVHSDPASDVDSLTIPEHWAEVNFGFVHRFTNGFTFPSNAYQESGAGIIRITEIKQQLIATQAMKFVDSKYFTDLDAKFQVKPGDLVIAMSGATTGGIAFNRADETFLLNQRVGKIEPILVNPEFVAMFLVSMKDQFLTNAAGSAIPNLSTKQIQEARFALPPVEEQERIVAKVQELMRLCDHLEVNLNIRTEIESAFAHSSSQLLSL